MIFTGFGDISIHKSFIVRKNLRPIKRCIRRRVVLGDDGDGGSSGDDHAAAATAILFGLGLSAKSFLSLTGLYFCRAQSLCPPTTSVVLLLNFRILHCL